MHLKLNIPNLRNTLKLNISQALTFKNIIRKADIPYNFDLIKNYWWRWYSEIFGFYYHRIKRTYCIWVTTFLKRNLNIKMPFYFLIMNNNKNPLSKYKNYIFLYNVSLIQKIYLHYWEKLTFNLITYKNLSDSAKFVLFPKNKKHRSIGSYGVQDRELDMFFSSYNANWNNLYKKNSLYYQCNRMYTNFFIIISSSFINSNFFINSYDSLINLYPQYYLTYQKNKNYIISLNNFLGSNYIGKPLIYIKLINILGVYLYNSFYYFKKLEEQKLIFTKEFNIYKSNKFKYIYLRGKKNHSILNNIHILNKFFNLCDITSYMDNKKSNLYLNYIWNLNNQDSSIKIYIIKTIEELNKLKKFRNKSINSSKYNYIIYRLYYQNCIINKTINLFTENILLLNNKKKCLVNFFLSSNKKVIKFYTRIKWLTKYKKYFYYAYNLKNKNINGYLLTTNSSKISWYLINQEFVKKQIKLILTKINYLLLNVYKFNFSSYFMLNNIFELKRNTLYFYLFMFKLINFKLINNLKVSNNIEKKFLFLIKKFNYRQINLCNYYIKKLKSFN